MLNKKIRIDDIRTKTPLPTFLEIKTNVMDSITPDVHIFNQDEPRRIGGGIFGILS